MRIIFSLFLCLLLINNVFAQSEDHELVQFSGVIVSKDSLIPLPYTNIIIKDSRRGTVSDFFGFFSFVAREGDTLEFSAVGFKKSRFIIPDSLTNNRYSLIQIMSRDTVLLQEAVIYPWPSKEQFKEAFLNLKVPDDDMERARRNLALAELRARAKAMPADGSLNFKYVMKEETSKLYYAGQLPPNNLLNPLAWAAFIKAWQDGDFKNKE